MYLLVNLVVVLAVNAVISQHCLSGEQQSKQKFFLWDLFLSPFILLYLKEVASLSENELP